VLDVLGSYRKCPQLISQSLWRQYLKDCLQGLFVLRSLLSIRLPKCTERAPPESALPVP
jgi:hypothetical protein